MRWMLVSALLLVAGCQTDGMTYIPGSPGVEEALEPDAAGRVPEGYTVQSVSVVGEYGTVGMEDGQEIVGYNAWIRVEGCGGYVVVHYDRSGLYRYTSDRTRCS